MFKIVILIFYRIVKNFLAAEEINKQKACYNKKVGKFLR